MPKHRIPIRRLAALLGLAALLLTAGVAPGRPAAAQSSAEDGVVCTTDANNTFNLTAQPGYILMPDGNVVYMWSMNITGMPFQYPGPVLCVEQGATVTITLTNSIREPVGLIFPGQEQVLANGTAAQPEFGGTNGTLSSLVQTAAANGGTMTYSFVAGRPGTFLYQAGSNMGVQVHMGLVGGLIVRPTGHPNWAYDRADSAFYPTREYLLLLSEIDPVMHSAISKNRTFNMATYRPRYWLINGRGFPDTIAPNFASWLPSQPYGALARTEPYHPTTNPHPALVRYLGAGSIDYPFHPHGNHSDIIARDAEPLTTPGGESLSHEMFSIPVGPGQTVDALFSWYDANNFDPNGNPIPITVPNDQNLALGPYYSGSPYLGTQEALPPGTENYNQCGEYYHVAHNHALQQITGWNTTMNGQITYTRIDPPGGCPVAP